MVVGPVVVPNEKESVVDGRFVLFILSEVPKVLDNVEHIVEGVSVIVF